MGQGLQVFSQDGELVFDAASQNSMKLIAAHITTSGIGSYTFPATGYSGFWVFPFAEVWVHRPYYTIYSFGGIAFFDSYYSISGNTLSWNVPKSTSIGGLKVPWDEIKLYMYIFAGF